jgi:hypothetical protein
MSSLSYLAIALGLSVSLSLAVWWARYRKPTTFMSSIDSFRREMDALGREVGRQNRAQREGPPETDDRPER